MRMLLHKRMQSISALLRDERANQLVELAVVLPILLVLAVGIFDFGQAFTLRQQLNNAAREAARLGSTQPTADLSEAAPPSVKDIRDLIDSYFQTSRINDCNLGPITATGAWQEWQAVGNDPTNCSSGQLTITIDRGVPVSSLPSSPITVNIISTHVKIQYPFQWHFTKVIQLITPGATGPSSTISGDAVMANMD
jgi:Flp pilus assembly protein TadG